MAELQIRPLRKWEGELTIHRKTSPFSYKTSESATMQLLEKELDAVGAHASVLQLAITDDDIRVSGVLRASIRTEHPGVLLTFTSSKIGKVRFSTDRFLRWQDNLRAIALGMEALRKVDRYGITSGGEQYAGFRAIEAAESARGFETVEQAARYIATYALDGAEEDKVERIADAMLIDGELVETYYRRAAKLQHPDAGGSETIMAKIVAARAMLDGAAS